MHFLSFNDQLNDLWDDNTVQVFLSVSKKEYYLVQQFTKSYEFKVMVSIITKNEATRCPPHH